MMDNLKKLRSKDTRQNITFDLTVVIPVYNQENRLEELVKHLLKVLLALEIKFEIIMVDDGSHDNSFRIIQDISINDNHIKGLKLKKNMGQHIAIFTGLVYASGKCILIMDDDAEDYIRAIPQFWQKIEGGFDVVSGQRACRHEAGLIRQMLIRCVNLAIGLLSQKKYSDATSSFKMFKRDLLENVLKKSKGNLLIPEFVMLKGKKVEEVLLPQKHSKGRSKSRYTLKKFMTHGLMLFGSFYMIFCNEGRLDSKNTSRQTILENIGKTVGIDRY